MREELACGCVKQMADGVLIGIELCKDHEMIFAEIRLGGKVITTPPALGVHVAEAIQMKDKPG